jgi:hypothetical protein
MIDIEKEAAEELARYGLTPGGRLVRLWLQSVILNLPAPGASESALREFHGKCHFASETISKLDRDYGATNGRDAAGIPEHVIVRNGGNTEPARPGALRRRG